MNFENKSEILFYQTEDGLTRIQVQMENETVWLSFNQMAELFQRDKSVISRHIKNIFNEGELNEKAVVAKYATTAADGKTYNVDYYNLDVIISVGYRVKSHRGTQFRIWALQVLKEYIIKGFAMNDDLLKKAGGGNYFEELLERIRDIRSSEKVFYRKVLDIYATSIDYSPDTAISQQFFQTVQNKMHWAAHGHTAAEIVYLRSDSEKPFLGMTSFTGSKPTRSESQIAKNYLSEDELAILNRIVNAYIEFAELQALRKKPMYMADWIGKLDDFIMMSDNEILTHAGKINHVEGNSLTEIETKILLEDGLTVGGKPIRDYYEATGHAKAYDYIYTIAHGEFIGEKQIKTIHRLFYSQIDLEKAGDYRQERVIITGSAYPAPAPDKIPQLMSSFIHWLAQNEDKLRPVEFTAQAHKRFVFIHPFIDGNGRVARLLMNLCLIRNGYTIGIIPPVLRNEYIIILEKAHKNDKPFVKFIAERVAETQKDLIQLLK